MRYGVFLSVSFTFILKDDEGVAISDKDVTIYDKANANAEIFSGMTDAEGIIEVTDFILDNTYIISCDGYVDKEFLRFEYVYNHDYIYVQLSI